MFSEHSLAKHEMLIDEGSSSGSELVNLLPCREKRGTVFICSGFDMLGKKSRGAGVGLEGTKIPLCMKQWANQLQGMKEALCQEKI